MNIECPHCSKQYEVEPQYIGKNLQCPDCEKEFEIKNPNLIPCPDCFSMISKRANGCPRCGAPLSSPITTYNGQPQQVVSNDISTEKDIMICHPSAMNYLWVSILGIITIPVLLIGVLILLYVWIEIHYTSYRIIPIKNQIALIIQGQQNIWDTFLAIVNVPCASLPSSCSTFSTTSFRFSK